MDDDLTGGFILSREVGKRAADIDANSLGHYSTLPVRSRISGDRLTFVWPSVPWYGACASSGDLPGVKIQGNSRLRMA
jgi:hypothetical protein